MSENTEKKPDKPEDEELSEDELEGVSGGTGTISKVDLSKAKLQASPTIKNPLVNVGMERNEQDELTAALNTVKTTK